MRPAELVAGSFASYPPQARALAVEFLPTLQQLPLNFLGVLLRELIGYDLRLPAEQAEIRTQLERLSRAAPVQRAAWMEPFARLPLDQHLYAEPWVTHPAQFVEKLTAYLWKVHAIDAYRQAAKDFEQVQTASTAPAGESTPRWCFVVVGRDAQKAYPDLFQQLRRKGTTFTQVDPARGWETLLAFVQARASANPVPYDHWYVDGEAPSALNTTAPLSTVSYQQLAPVREQILRRMHQVTASNAGGPEDLRSLMAQLRTADVTGAKDHVGDPVLENFNLTLLTEGSGTQIFSTTFVQWAGREILRRAQPQTLLMRYAPRQEDRPMNDLLAPNRGPAVLDAEGSLVDASMGAWYTWLSLQRLPGAQQSRFLAWRESGREAVVIAPGIAEKGLSNQHCTVAQLLQWMA